MQREEAIVTYFWIILLAFAVVLTVKGILQWAGNPKRRQSRLKIVSICAFLFLIVMLVLFNLEEIHRFIEGIEKVNGSATTLMVNTSKVIVKSLLIVIVVSFSIIIALIGILFAAYGVWAIIRVITACLKNECSKEKLEKDLKESAEKIVILFKTSAFKIIIAGGILALYVMLPIIMGNDESDSLAECWDVGLEKIAEYCFGQQEIMNSFSQYSLVFIALIGVGYVAFSILYEIIKERLAKKDVFLNEYSSSIGVLAVGVALLLAASESRWGKLTSIKDLLEKAEPFLVIIFVIAFGVLTLEIVRLLLDMKERLIRRMARYLFVLLVGLCTSIFVKVLLMVFNTLVSILGRKNVILDDVEEHMERMCNRIMIKLMEDMEEELNRKDTNDKKLRIPFKAFKGRVVRKEEGK